jgi:hypothetical protein
MLAGKPTRNKSLGKRRRTWEDNIKMNLKTISVKTRIWIKGPSINYVTQISWFFYPPNSPCHWW